MTPELRVGDAVTLTDFAGRTWRGMVTALRPDEIYVRWPDGVIGIFRRRHAKHLKRVA